MFFLITILLASDAGAVDVLFINVTENQSNFAKSINLVCDFYGLTFKDIFLGETNNKEFSSILDQDNFNSLIMTASALNFFDPGTINTVTSNLRLRQINIFIIDINTNADNNILNQFSQGVIKQIQHKEIESSDLIYKINAIDRVTLELSEQEIPVQKKEENLFDYFVLEKKEAAESIIEAVEIADQDSFAVFCKVKNRQSSLFFLTKSKFTETSLYLQNPNERSLLVNYIPIFMFLKFSFGDRCWHAPDDYANLTIDDPWLTEPYGNLSYERLLSDMKQANFHSTIAFIPWNFDRSDDKVVSIVKNNPTRYSICIHGNNHDHQEFEKFEIDNEKNIQQAIARMECFKDLTGLSYDKVMVFPHLIAPAPTLGQLKKYNFLATVNDGNVPAGLIIPNDPVFYLRPVTLRFENFPSLNRYYPNRTEVEIAFDLFLDNPQLFYVHQDFFSGRNNAFNKTAAMVNTIQPNMKWLSIGEIAQKLYLLKHRAGNNYDIKAFCNSFIINNKFQHTVNYFIEKEEGFTPAIHRILVDDKPIPFKKFPDKLVLQITIPPGKSRKFKIEYINDLDIATIDISKNDASINRLRRLSDFRDMVLSLNYVGRIISNLYYDTDIYKIGIKRLIIYGILIMLFFIISSWYLIQYAKNKKMSKI